VSTPILWYFADPMCSWCWGFSPVIDALRSRYRERLQIALVLGGLRPGTATPLSSAARDEILHHWRAVHARTGQPFGFDHALPPGFVYDTEPPSRAVLAVASVDAALTFAYFRVVQSAFYAEGRDVTQVDVLASLATDQGIDAATFRARFDSEAMRARTLAHFAHARRAGVRGFPALILQQDTKLTPVSEGCQPLDVVDAAIEACLA
jgi:putative protein-disulfide isomerase